MNPSYLGAVAGAAMPPKPQPVDPHWDKVVLLLNGDSLQDATGRHVVNVHAGTPTVSDGMIWLPGDASLRIDDKIEDFDYGNRNYTWEGTMHGVTAGAATMVWMSTLEGVDGWEIFTRGAPTFKGGWFAYNGTYFEPDSPAWVRDEKVEFALVHDITPGVMQLRLYINCQLAFTAAAKTSAGGRGTLFVGQEGANVLKRPNGGFRACLTQDVARYSGASYTPVPWPRPTRGP